MSYFKAKTRPIDSIKYDQLLFMGLLCLFSIFSITAKAGDPSPLDPVLTTIESGFSSAVALRNAGDGSDRLFVVERGGRIKIIEDGDTLDTPFLNIDPLTNGGGEQGLLGLAFHPNYSTNGFFYVYYTNTSGDTVVARYSVSTNDPNVADANSALKIISIDQDFGNHNGGDIHFSPSDGYLYVGLGDGGSGNDPCDRGQTRDPDDIVTGSSNGENCNADQSFLNQGGNADSLALLGAMLRIDVDNPGQNVSDACGEGVNYGIPSDNPFSDGNNDCGEIWAWGLRNPYRWGFDRDTGDLFIGDVGQFDREEVNFQLATSNGGENYGWVCREGNIANPNVTCNAQNAVDPILDYNQRNATECSVVSGFRYRGPETTWQGTYIFADYCTGVVYWSTENNGVWNGRNTLIDSMNLITSFGEDEQGNIYVLNFGRVLKLSDANFNDDIIFTNGFES